MWSRLDQVVENNNLLTENQYGFRANRAPSMALNELTEEIINNTDKKLYAVYESLLISKKHLTL